MLKPEETTAYDAFLQSGKIEDYMRYVGVKRQTQATAAQSAAAAGENGAYHNRGDRPAGTVG